MSEGPMANPPPPGTKSKPADRVPVLVPLPMQVPMRAPVTRPALRPKATVAPVQKEPESAPPEPQDNRVVGWQLVAISVTAACLFAVMLLAIVKLNSDRLGAIYDKSKASDEIQQLTARMKAMEQQVTKLTSENVKLKEEAKYSLAVDEWFVIYRGQRLPKSEWETYINDPLHRSIFDKWDAALEAYRIAHRSRDGSPTVPRFP